MTYLNDLMKQLEFSILKSTNHFAFPIQFFQSHIKLKLSIQITNLIKFKLETSDTTSSESSIHNTINIKPMSLLFWCLYC